MSYNLTETVTLETVVCCTCGTVYAMLDQLRRSCKKTGQTFYCPNGHAQVFSRSATEELQDKLNETNQKLAQVEWELLCTQRSYTATKGVVTKLKKRAANGVCPCCHRQFVSVARHMKTMHPDFVEEQP